MLFDALKILLDMLPKEKGFNTMNICHEIQNLKTMGMFSGSQYLESFDVIIDFILFVVLVLCHYLLLGFLPSKNLNVFPKLMNSKKKIGYRVGHSHTVCI